MNNVTFLLQRARLALQEFGPSMALLMLPGGYLVALTGWIHRRWRLESGRGLSRRQ
ncbi:MAG: hypothetical protein ABSC32_10585 [Steroidobacteraceae bacterium]|jgi:hypothetical protein